MLNMMTSSDELKFIGHIFMNNMSYFLVEHCDPTIEGQEFKTYDQMKDNLAEESLDSKLKIYITKSFYLKRFTQLNLNNLINKT